MKHTPIIAYDKRTFRMGGMELRQTGTKPGFPILIEHRRVGSQWWDIANGDACHSQQTWAETVRQGVEVKA